jgi:hypothetical protein
MIAARTLPVACGSRLPQRYVMVARLMATPTRGKDGSDSGGSSCITREGSLLNAGGSFMDV